MHNTHIKRKAIYLRENGETVRAIAKRLGVSFSTISFWCRDIKLSKSVIQQMQFKKKDKSIKGLLRFSEKRRAQRIENTLNNKKEGVKMITPFSKRDLLMVGIGLYWGEGYKESNSELGFTNSNPFMLRFYIIWLNLFKVQRKDLIFRLSINKIYSKYEKEIKEFWIKYLRVEEGQFTKTSFVKTKLKKASSGISSDYKGILRIKVRRGLELKNKILGSIEYIANMKEI